MLELLKHIAQTIVNWFSVQLITVGDSAITIGTIIQVIVLSVLVIGVARLLRRWLKGLLMHYTGGDIGRREALASLAYYCSLAIGMVVVLQMVGIDLSTLGLIVGALGVGIGFGLQNIVNDFIGGIVLLLERPVEVGDRIELEGKLIGDVIEIGMRATSLRTLDNIAIIIPNSHFIHQQITNWSHTDNIVRYAIPVGVSYREDPIEVQRLLLEVAAEHPDVIKEPVPDVLLQEFGSSSLNFVLRVWMGQIQKAPLILISEINFAISAKFREHNIEIPYPQRDLNVRSGVLEVRTVNTPPKS